MMPPPESHGTVIPGRMHETEDVATGEDLARFLERIGGPWMPRLLSLIATADAGQRARLRVAFPREVITWEIWSALEEIPSAGELRFLVGLVWPPPPVLGIPDPAVVAQMVADYKAGRIALPSPAARS